eukprot:scaffold121860_cov28-Phaeocystis_antarctica.AAC.1
MRSPHDHSAQAARCALELAARATSSVDGNSDVSPSIRLQRVAACRDNRKLRNNLPSAKPRTRVVSACSLYLQSAPCQGTAGRGRPSTSCACASAITVPRAHHHQNISHQPPLYAAHQPALYLARINVIEPPPLTSCRRPCPSSASSPRAPSRPGEGEGYRVRVRAG